MAKGSKEKKGKRETKRKVMEGARDLFTGEWLTSVFFGKHKFAVLMGVALLVLYISYKYEYQTRMREITTLRTELAKVKSESIRQKSLYRSNIRESEMVRRIHEAGLDLRMQHKPPYQLQYEE